MTIKTIVFDLDDTLLWDEKVSRQHLSERVTKRPSKKG